MSVQGKEILSFQKKDTENQRTLGVGFEKLIFFHQGTVGDSSINLGALTLPTEIASAGFLNPSATKLTSSNIKAWRNNFTLESSIRGPLWDYLTYDVINSSLIAFKNGFVALDGEVFKGTIDLSARTGITVVEGRAVVATGELTVGQTDIYIPEGFELNKNPSTQVGAVLVEIDGIGMLRNEGNAVYGLGVKGNYQEVAGPGNVGSIIRLNTAATLRPDGTNKAYKIYSMGLVAERPAQSMLAFLESIGGQINTMLPYLAAVAGVPVSTFGANPTSIDLSTFSNKLNALYTPPTIQKFLSGSGTYSPTSSAVRWIRVRIVGGGGGGGGAGTNGAQTSGATGGRTSFGAFLQALGGGGGGSGAPSAPGSGGIGGVATITPPMVGVLWNGVAGGYGAYNYVAHISGPPGGNSVLGGAGAGGMSGGGNAINAATNSGSGGGGAGSFNGTNLGCGGGGGAAGYIEAIIAAPTSFAYSVGTGGTGGTAGANGGTGGNGGSGIIIVEEFY